MTQRMLVAVGAVAILVGLTADWVGLGPNPGIGKMQIALMVLGMAVVAAGIILGVRSQARPDSTKSDE